MPKSNYAIKPTPEQALGSDRTQPPARLIAALDFNGEYFVLKPRTVIAFVIVILACLALATVGLAFSRVNAFHQTSSLMILGLSVLLCVGLWMRSNLARFCSMWLLTFYLFPYVFLSIWKLWMVLFGGENSTRMIVQSIGATFALGMVVLSMWVLSSEKLKDWFRGRVEI